MSDSGSSCGSGETRMLQRRVSNNRADLDSDQQMNYFLAWFSNWSDLQRSDFVNVLAEKMSKQHVANGLADSMNSTDFDLGNANPARPPSLFTCQVKLFREWFARWSDDQKNYLVLRLQNIDPEFFAKYETYVDNPRKSPEKDFFEPGVPEHLIQHSNHHHHHHDESTASEKAVPANGSYEEEDEHDEGDDDEDEEILKKKHSITEKGALSPISEDY